MEGDELVAEAAGVRVYLDQFLKRLADRAVVEYSPSRQKFWLIHPELM
ncbi:MAG TPA: hypothetical protein VK464_05650 [Symbiobacteriaceae bacterium]|nr:hypothetical protein [Symbiobacteriaceae bacterium]